MFPLWLLLKLLCTLMEFPIFLHDGLVYPVRLIPGVRWGRVEEVTGSPEVDRCRVGVAAGAQARCLAGSGHPCLLALSPTLLQAATSPSGAPATASFPGEFTSFL